MKQKFCLLWCITTCLSAITISVLLIIEGIEINPGLGSTSDEEISLMEIEDSLHDTFDFSTETLQRTLISSQIVLMTSLDFGFLHFRKSVVILTRARLNSMGDQTIIDQVCYLSL